MMCMKGKSSQAQPLAYLWMGMLITGIAAIIAAIIVQSLDNREVKEQSLTELIEKQLMLHSNPSLEKEETQQAKTVEIQSETQSIINDDSLLQNGIGTSPIITEVPPIQEIGQEQVMIPTTSQAMEKININSASAEKLQTLKGIGPSKANAIIQDREQKGNYRNIEDIKRVKGIGEKVFAGIKESIVAE